MSEHQPVNCAICGSPLVYLNTVEAMQCHDCGAWFRAEVRCEQGHYLCDACHSHTANDYIEQACLSAGGTDPARLAVRLMEDRRVKMHGPEHHFLVPAVLLAAYANRTGQDRFKSQKIKTARERAEKVPGGFCGTHGSCGAAVGTGIFISLVTGATPVKIDEWRLSNLVTARALTAIAEHGGPRCCKRDSMLAIEAAAAFALEQFSVDITPSEAFRCEFSALNRECLKTGCPYFSGRLPGPASAG